MRICSSRKDLYFLGAGFPMFFQFTILGIGLLFMIFILSSLYNFATNIHLDACAKEELYILGDLCVPSWWISISLLSKYGHEDYLIGQGINNLITVIFVIIYLQFFRYKQRIEADRCDKKLLSASDFAIEVRGIPETDTISDIRKEFENKLVKDFGYSGELQKIVLVNRSFTISNMVEILKKQEEFVKQKTRLDRWIKMKEGDNLKKSMKIKKNEQELNKLKLELAESYKKREEMESNLQTSKSELSKKQEVFCTQLKFTGTAFIVFQTPEQAKQMRKQMSVGWIARIKIYLKKLVCLNNKELYKNSYFLDVRRAPEPNDIIWENLDVPKSKKLFYIFLTNIATGVLLLFSFAMVLGISYLQSYFQKKQLTFFQKQVVNMMGAVLITLINHTMHDVIEKFTKYEKPSTYTNFDSSLAQKKVMALFLNTSIIYILVSWAFDSFAGKNGLVENLFYIFLSNMIVTSCIVFVDIGAQIKRVKRWLCERSSWVLSHIEITQQEANSLYEGSTLNVPSSFASILNVMLFSGFYASVVPLGPLLGIITLTIYYWVFKYTLLVNSRVPKSLGKRVSMEMIEYAEYVPLVLALGDFIFVRIFYDKNSLYNLIAIILCCVNFLLPMKLINKKIVKIKKKKTDDDKEINYYDIRQTLQFEYERCNPITKKKANDSKIKKSSSDFDEIYDELKDFEMADLEKYSESSNIEGIFKKKKKD